MANTDRSHSIDLSGCPPNASPWNLSFAGCGFLGIYHVGVATCIRQYAPHLASGVVSGASAGALAATGLICNCDLGEATTQVLDVALKIRSMAIGVFTPSFRLADFVYDLLDDFLPYDAHIQTRGRLRVSVTKLSLYGMPRNVILSDFNTREELIQALVCSSFIPMACGYSTPKFRGETYYDGGLTDNIPMFDKNTITVSPFAGESDISPKDVVGGCNHIHLANTSIQLSPGNYKRAWRIIFPPSPKELHVMCQKGFDDCLKFLHANNHMSCIKHYSVQSIISSTKADEDDDSSNDKKDETAVSMPDVVDILDLASQEDIEYCDECRQMKRLAILDTLPLTVIKPLQAACRTVNDHILLRLNDLGFKDALWLISTVLLLPVQLGVEVGKGVFDWIDYLPEWLQDALKYIGEAVYGVYEFVEDKRHGFSARFECQIALTEVEDYSRELFRPRHSSGSVNNRQLNFDLTTDTDMLLGRSAQDYVNDVRLQLMVEHPEVKKEEDVVLSDTMHNCLHVCHQMDAVLAYHYTTEDKKVCLSEIYPIGQSENQEAVHQAWSHFLESSDNSEEVRTFHIGHVKSQPNSGNISRSSSVSSQQSNLKKPSGENKCLG